MVASVKFFVVILLSSLISKGSCGSCELTNLNVFEEQTGRQIRGQPEWQVTVTNNCSCTRSAVVLSCQGFHTAENVPESLLVPTADGRCLLKGGQPLKPFEAVKFAYAWWPPTVFWPKTFTVGSCVGLE